MREANATQEWLQANMGQEISDKRCECRPVGGKRVAGVDVGLAIGE
jgi:hypothetical protein